MSISLKPGETRILRFILIDPILSWGYSYGYNYACSENVPNEESMVKIVKDKGTLKVVNYQG